MTLPALVTELELSGRRGGPFPADELASACAAVRGECGWHVAPVVEHHRVLVSGPPGPRLVLPSLRIIEVTAIRDVRTDQLVTGWREGASGMLVRDAGWPRGEDNLQVELTHGHDACPGDLLAVVVGRARELADPAPANVGASSYAEGGISSSVTYRDPSAGAAWPPSAGAILDRYRV